MECSFGLLQHLCSFFGCAGNDDQIVNKYKMGKNVVVDFEARFVGGPCFLEGMKEVLNGKDEENAAFRGALLATSFEWNVFFRLAAPNVGGYFVTKKLAAKIEYEEGVNVRFHEAFKNSTLVYCVKCFLKVDFNDGEGLCPFKVSFDCALDGVQGFSCLAMAPVPTLGFSNVLVNVHRALGEKPSSVEFL